MKKFTAVFTTLVLLLSMAVAGVTVSAEEWEDFAYSVQGDTVTLEEFISDPDAEEEINVVIPETIDGKTVTTLAATLFEDDWMVNIVEVPATVTTIEEGALDMAWIIFCQAGSAAEAYAKEWELTYCVDGVVYDPFDGTATPLPTGMEISSAPDQTALQDGSNYFDLTGLEVTFTFADGSEDTWVYAGEEEEFYYNNWPLSVELNIETGTLTVTYMLDSASMDIEILPNPVAGIEVTKWPQQGSYQDWELTLTEADGSTKTVAGQDGIVIDYIDTPEMSIATLGIEDSDYGPVVALVAWVRQEGAFATAILYMDAISVRAQPDFDVNGQDGTTAADALMALQAATQKIELDTAASTAADTDGNGEVTASDALMILQAATGKLTTTINFAPGEFEELLEQAFGDGMTEGVE